jgi:nucleotide-binding universal stress UspA family protein
MERKILIGIDDTNYYMNILHYVSANFQNQPEVKFHLHGIVPCQKSDASREWLDEQELLNVVDPATRKKLVRMKHHLLDAKAQFNRCGFSEQDITTEAHLSKAGIVTDLIHEAQSKNYDAIVIGKRDLGVLGKMIQGSFSADMLTRNHTIPLWVINGASKSHNFFVPVDCSPRTLSAVDHLGFILKGNPMAEILLFHSASMLATEELVPKEKFYEKWGKEWCDEHLKGEESEAGHFHFHAPEQLLREAGFPMERVHRLKSEKGIEPAQMIVHHVKDGEYGTIVMGRRGKDVSKGLFRGVSDRVLANVENIAVWILG